MFKRMDMSRLEESAVRLIGEDWMLITAGSIGHFNTMTAAWGGLGFLWKKPTAYVFIRPTRHTFDFAEKNDFFTLSFFAEKHRDILQFCGAKSGRNVDKVKETGLTPIDFEGKAVYFQQARLVLICRKNYYQDLDPGKFLDHGIERNYPQKDYHRMYFGEIIETLQQFD